MIGEIFRCGEDMGMRKIRIIVGLVLGGDLYTFKKCGCLDPVGDERALSELAEQFWASFPRQGIEEIPIFGWQLGMPFEMDDDGNILGDWPQVGTLILPYSDAFLMSGGDLPEDRRHLHMMNLSAVASSKVRNDGHVADLR